LSGRNNAAARLKKRFPSVSGGLTGGGMSSLEFFLVAVPILVEMAFAISLYLVSVRRGGREGDEL
jgi:hypothetical protein